MALSKQSADIIRDIKENMEPGQVFHPMIYQPARGRIQTGPAMRAALEFGFIEVAWVENGSKTYRRTNVGHVVSA